MRTIIAWVVRRPRTVIGAWSLVLVVGGFFAARLDESIAGSTDGIPGSASEKALETIRRAFGPYSAFSLPVVVESCGEMQARDPRFAEAIASVERALVAGGSARAARHYWNSGSTELLGSDGCSALLLVTPTATTFNEAERLVPRIRADIAAAGLDSLFAAHLTGPVATFHDLNRHSADDLLVAERIGIPITLLILLCVFGAPLAAGVPVLLASTAVLISLAALFVMSTWMPVSVFARNVVAMIGLGLGVDYALFFLTRYREELGAGAGALVRAAQRTGRTVLVSGSTVAAGFLVLLLVHVPLMQSLAIGGAAVVLVAMAATFTLLPAVLALTGERIFWPAGARKLAGERWQEMWARWARYVIRRPWPLLIPALAVIALLIAPVRTISAWNPGAKDLPADFEARVGADALKRSFGAGWLGPVVIAFEVVGEGNVWDERRQHALRAMGARVARDPRIAQMGGPAVSASGSAALVVMVPVDAPESAGTMSVLRDLRRDPWPEAHAAGLAVHVAGASAGMADFDDELFAALWRVVPAVLAATFVMLLLMFRSVVIPLKAIVLNLLSVLAAWGFLVLVFQDGVGAAFLSLEPPGGLNAFIVLMLFTILFGLSMDYEVFVLARIKEEHDAGADNTNAVARGLQRTAGTITSAALVMICIFGSFAFTRLTATREFGLGLAFAVALDATLIRLVLVPALMHLLGEWNWWMPRWRAFAPRAAVPRGDHRG